MGAITENQRLQDIVQLCDLRKSSGLRCLTCIHHDDIKKVCKYEKQIAEYKKQVRGKAPGKNVRI